MANVRDIVKADVFMCQIGRKGKLIRFTEKGRSMS